MRLRVHPKADADYEAAYEWYAMERIDLARDFSYAVDQAVKDHGRSGTVAGNRTRCAAVPD